MANTPAQLPYGLRDGKLLSIEEAARGLACGCICPACQAPLVAWADPSEQAYWRNSRKIITFEC